MRSQYNPRWYSRHRGRQPTFDSLEDFTPAFWKEVGEIRQKFHMRKSEFGIDLPLNIDECWQLYMIKDTKMGLDDVPVRVALSRFEWGRVQHSVGESDGPLVPRFLLDMHLAMPNKVQEAKGILGNPDPMINMTFPDGHTFIHSCELTIEYHSKHPVMEPSFYIEGRQDDFDMEEHHWIDDNSLCIDVASNTNEGWRSYGRSVTRWIGLAVAWNVWHIKRYGF